MEDGKILYLNMKLGTKFEDFSPTPSMILLCEKLQ